MHAETLLEIAMMHADTLIVSAQKGDERSLNKLVELWYKRIYNYAYKYISEHDLATEISQKTFIAMFRNIKKLNDVDSFKPWLYRIATNLCHEEDRRSKRSNTISLSVAKNDEIDAINTNEMVQGNDFNPEQSFQQQELEEVLLSALNGISEEHRSVVIMKEYEGFKFWEIAAVLEISENTAKTRLYAGLKSLKDILGKMNITKETMYYEL